MKTELVSDERRLAELGSQWNELLAASESDRPFMRWEWCTEWWRHYGAGQELAVVLVWDGELLIGLAPLFVHRTGRHSGVMEYLGAGEVCSEYLSFALRHGHESAANEAIVRFLFESGRLAWRQMRLNHVLADSPATGLLKRQLRTMTRPFDLERTTTTWWIELPATWEEYVASVSSNRRDKFKRMRREIKKRQLSHAVVKREDEIDAAWGELMRLHQARWTDRGQPGCFASARFTAFHAAMLRPLWRQGMLSLTLLREGERAVAASYAIRHGKRVYSYQSGVDPSRAQYAPGRILLMCDLEAAIEQGDRVYDFLAGEEDFKAQWSTHRAAMEHLAVAGRGMVPRIRFTLASLRRRLKAAARAQIPIDVLNRWQRWRQRWNSGRSLPGGHSPAAL